LKSKIEKYYKQKKERSSNDEDKEDMIILRVS
jgi:hypothetical protein